MSGTVWRWLVGIVIAFQGCAKAGTEERYNRQTDQLHRKMTSSEVNYLSKSDPLEGETTVDRATLVKTVLERNPSIASARSAWSAAPARYQQSTAPEDPMLTYEFSPISIGESDVRFGQGVSTKSLIETGVVLLAVPFSLIGAVWLLYPKLAHRRYEEEGRLGSFGDLTEAVVEVAAHRIRPKLMTVMTTMNGLLPILLELTVYPAAFALWKRRTAL